MKRARATPVPARRNRPRLCGRYSDMPDQDYMDALCAEAPGLAQCRATAARLDLPLSGLRQLAALMTFARCYHDVGAMEALLALGVPPSMSRIEFWSIYAAVPRPRFWTCSTLLALLSHGASPRDFHEHQRDQSLDTPEAAARLLADADRAWNASVTLGKLCEIRMKRAAWPWFLSD